MPKFAVDLDNVVSSMSKKVFKLSEVQGKIEKVAFDVVRFKDGNPEELWQVQTAEDGSSYIVALYNEEEKVATASIQSPWSVVIANTDIHFFYKKEHLCKVASAQLGFKSDDLSLAKRYLPKKLAENTILVKSLLKSVDQDTRKSILAKYPELA
jgi:hypothetical protein